MNDVLKLLNPWWYKKAFETGVKREKYLNLLEESLNHNRAVLLVGSRRVGKTTLLHQAVRLLLDRGVNPRQIMYVLGDHPYLSPMGLLQSVEELRTEFGLDRDKKLYVFFDEVQYIQEWERQAKALVDTENVKLFLSGSATSKILLEGNYLTGRLEKIEIWPLNYDEFLEFRGWGGSIGETEEYKHETYLKEYLKVGGYPEYVLKQDGSYFADLVSNVLQKDIVALYGLRNPDLLRDLFLLIADRHGSQATFTKLAKILGLKNDTVKEYLYYLENTFLVGEADRYATSRAKRVYAAKKFYVSDPGMLFHLQGRVNLGGAFEGIIYSMLKQTDRLAGFYYENGQEVDFVVNSDSGKQLWEVKYEWKEDDKKINEYVQAAKQIGADEVWIVNKNLTKILKRDGVKIRFKNWRQVGV